MPERKVQSQKQALGEKKTSIFSDIRLIFATILTDPGSSLAYGADAVIAVTMGMLYYQYKYGLFVTLTAGAIIMAVYLIAILVYNSMTKHHVHKELGGGAFVSSLITSEKIQLPWLKRLVGGMGRLGTASLLSDFPATQAISVIASVEALYFIPAEDRLHWAFAFIFFISMLQRYGLNNLARYLIWPVLAFYLANLLIQFYGLYEILTSTWQEPIINMHKNRSALGGFGMLLLHAIANGATLITGVEVGYSSINLPYHKGRAIRLSMWLLFGIVFITYSLQLINFLGLGINQQAMYADGTIPPVPIQIAQHLGGDFLALPFGLLTAIMLLLAAQTAQSDFPLELLRASRSNFFPKGIGDNAWRKIKVGTGMRGHAGIYNPRATILLAILSFIILYFFPHSHKIESMYGLAVITAMCIDIGSYFIRQARLNKYLPLTIISLLIMIFMLLNILYNKFFEGAWFIVILMVIYLFIFSFSGALYRLWHEKLNIIPLELALCYPAFAKLPIDNDNVILVSNFHPGILHFLKKYIHSKKHMPLLLHFQTNIEEQKRIPKKLPKWYRNIPVPPETDIVTAIKDYILEIQPRHVHLIPLLVRGIDSIRHYYFGNSMEAIQYAISEHADVQVEYNRERINITAREVLENMFRYLRRRHLHQQAFTHNPKQKKRLRKKKK